MAKIDMSPKAVTTRLKRVEQLRRLGLSLQKAKIGSSQEGDKESKPNSRSKKSK